MEQEFVGLLVGRLAVVARRVHGDIGGDDADLRALHRADYGVRYGDGVGAGTLGHGDGNGGHALERAVLAARKMRDAVFLRLRREDHIGEVAHIDRTPVARGDEYVCDIGEVAQRRSRNDIGLLAAIADAAGEKGAVGALDDGGELLQRDA